jgi:hypothetical protein
VRLARVGSCQAQYQQSALRRVIKAGRRVPRQSHAAESIGTRRGVREMLGVVF